MVGYHFHYRWMFNHDSGPAADRLSSSNVDCKQWFRRIIEIQEPKIQLGKRIRKTTPASSRKRSKQAIVEGDGYDEDEAAEDEAEIQQFRRVQVVHNNTIPTISPLHVPSDSEVPRQRLQSSSYWSVPEQTDFPALLGHFGTDWHGIAKWMCSKTHIMVYRTVFQDWLIVPSDSNRGLRLANIQTQVKNYYQRQVDSGKMSLWEQIAHEADEKISRGEDTGPLPTPTILPKRCYDMQYQRQPQYPSQDGYPSPQLGPTYYPQSQQPPPLNHRHLAFGQSQSHVASPPTQYSTQRPLHRSRGNSFDGRYQMATTSGPPSAQQSYAQAPHHPGTPLSMQYQQPHPSRERYSPPQDADSRMQEEIYYQRQRQREIDNRRRIEDQRRLEEQRRMEEQQRGLDNQRRLDEARRF
jgi:hypothetical protein